MSPTPLRLESYFFTKVHVDANPAYSPDKQPKEQDIQVDVSVGILRSKKDADRYQLALEIDRVHSDSAELPYQFSVAAVASVIVDPDLKHPDVARLVKVNGSSMLYSAARELVLLVTGRGPWGSFQLPTLNFHSAIQPTETQIKKTAKSNKTAKSGR
jgi:preprotein translocase subunit SecB